MAARHAYAAVPTSEEDPAAVEMVARMTTGKPALAHQLVAGSAAARRRHPCCASQWNDVWAAVLLWLAAGAMVASCIARLRGNG